VLERPQFLSLHFRTTATTFATSLLASIGPARALRLSASECISRTSPKNFRSPYLQKHQWTMLPSAERIKIFFIPVCCSALCSGTCCLSFPCAWGRLAEAAGQAARSAGQRSTGQQPQPQQPKDKRKKGAQRSTHSTHHTHHTDNTQCTHATHEETQQGTSGGGEERTKGPWNLAAAAADATSQPPRDAPHATPRCPSRRSCAAVRCHVFAHSFLCMCPSSPLSLCVCGVLRAACLPSSAPLAVGCCCCCGGGGAAAADGRTGQTKKNEAHTHTQHAHTHRDAGNNTHAHTTHTPSLPSPSLCSYVSVPAACALHRGPLRGALAAVALAGARRIRQRNTTHRQETTQGDTTRHGLIGWIRMRFRVC
jgi:hypothetical protein